MNYCVYGTESVRIKNKIDSIFQEERIVDNGMNIAVYDAVNSDFSIAQVIEDCWTIPFLAEKKIVHVKNAFFLSSSATLNELEQNQILEYLKKPCPDTVLVFSGVFEKIDNRKKIGKNIKQLMRCFECNTLDESEFHAYVKDRMKKSGIQLEESAYQELLSRLKPDLMNFEHVLNKLSLYPDVIDVTVIKKLVSRPLDDNVFDLVNAVVSGDLKASMHLWRDLQVTNADPIGLLTLISNQFRLIYQVKVLFSSKHSESEIASILKVHPYRVKLARSSGISISLKRLETIIQMCAELDQQFKSGTVDRVLGFETFLIYAAKR